MKCNQCDEEFANSEELKRHQEQAHPMADVQGKEEPALEQPDLLDRPVVNVPEPAER